MARETPSGFPLAEPIDAIDVAADAALRAVLDQAAAEHAARAADAAEAGGAFDPILGRWVPWRD